MTESLNNNLENVRTMALQLRKELDGYVHEKELAELWFSDSDEETQKCLAGIRKGWGEQNIKNPPSYIPASEIPTCDEISQLENAEELTLCVDTLFNALRFLRLLGSVKNDFPALEGPKLNIKIKGDDVDKVDTTSNAIHDAIIKVLPFAVSTHFFAPRGITGPVRESISFKYIDGYDKELQNAVVRTRIAIIAQKLGVEFDEERMAINID